MQKEIPCK